MPEIKTAKLERGNLHNSKPRLGHAAKKKGEKNHEEKKGETSIYHASDL